MEFSKSENEYLTESLIQFLKIYFESDKTLTKY